MEASSKDGYMLRLGQELKLWEQQFAASHGGRKPAREDIKRETAMASKYSEYHRLRTTRSDKSSGRLASPRSSKKRKCSIPASDAIKDPPKSISTPRKNHRQHLAEHKSPQQLSDENASPASAKRYFVGPTPQKDGRVLGLFDLSPEGTTPSKGTKPQAGETQPSLGPLGIDAVASTPTKSATSPHAAQDFEYGQQGDPLQTTGKNSRTPQSSGKRFLLDSFVTPSKRRRVHETTPQSRTKLGDSATPAFLQRDLLRLPPVHEEGNTVDATEGNIASRLPPRSRTGAKRKSLTRSFSSMIADIRRAEDDRLDEELEMLRDMEAENFDDDEPMDKPRSKPNVLVEDSQAVNTLGPDGAGMLSEDEEDLKQSLGRDGQPLRIWKKRGQKRQTRRVIMRPAVKAKPSIPTAPSEAAEESGDDGSVEAVDDHTGQGASETLEAEANDVGDGESDVEYELDSDDELQGSEQPRKKRKTSPRGTKNLLGPTASEQTKGANINIVQKAVKKISATANANFRRLKIRSSKGAKAVGKGRFGRGRR